jgi:SAM-dependent methyltransferase
MVRPRRRSLSAVGVHRAAAEGFGRAAANYERGRPGYPEAAVEWLVSSLGIGPGTTVVDLGAGTGKFTRMLRPTGARIIAIEPVPAMRKELERAVRGVEILDGTAEAIPCSDASADAITAAQAFHWFATSRALSEMHRVLREGGGLGLIWNRRDQRDALQAGLDAVICRHRGQAPAHEANDWRAVIQTSPLFQATGERQFRHEQVVDLDGLVDRVLSTSFIAMLSERDRAAVAGEVRALARGQATIVLPYRTDVFAFRRT